jgi:4-amino-4-deoxy-L-arabinose transferase-like glycosyltransferase
MTESSSPAAGFQPSARAQRWLTLAALLGLLAFGLAIRLIDLTDQPLDFHPLRQLNSAVISRGMYYEMSPSADPAQRAIAVDLWKGEEIYEPRLLERLIALTYVLAGGEYIWIGRLYSILFWLLGGLALFDLSRRLAGTGGALFGLGFYLVLPFAVVASRSLQPDPLMTALIVASVWAQVRWRDSGGRWGWALAAGVLGGLAALLKPWAGLFAGLPAAALVLTELGLRRALRDARVWALAVVMVAIPAVYYFLLIPGRSPGYFQYWTIMFGNLRANPAFYIWWLQHIRGFIDFSALIAALAGAALLRGRGRAVALSLWAAYLIFGLLMPFQIHTHDYYSLPLVPVVAISLAGLAQVGFERFIRQPKLAQALLLAVMLAALIYPAWLARTTLIGNDYRSEGAGWRRIAAQLPTDGVIVALTHGDGMYLKYYGMRRVRIYPSKAEIDLDVARGSQATGFDELFASRTSGSDYFLVTLMGELDAQPELKARLETYRVVLEGDGFILYDLRSQVK